jgi:hypothetical protein
MSIDQSQNTSSNLHAINAQTLEAGERAAHASATYDRREQAEDSCPGTVVSGFSSSIVFFGNAPLAALRSLAPQGE